MKEVEPPVDFSRLTYITVTPALNNFRYALRDIKKLLELHDTETKRRPGRPSPAVEVLKRAGVVLAVTAWESFIEDALTAAFEQRLKSAKAPRDIPKTFNAVAHAWLSRNGSRPPDLAAWTGEDWKKVLRENLAREIDRLNTPNSANVARLSRCYLDLDLTAAWERPGAHRETVRAKLDALIALRGRLVHRTRARFALEQRASVRRKDLVDAITLLTSIVQRTEQALGRGPMRAGKSVHSKGLIG